MDHGGVSEGIFTVGVDLLGPIRGLVHGFEQRPLPRGHETREEGRLRVAGALQASGKLFLLKQVHGAEVLRAPWEGAPEGDAGLAEEAGVLVGIETADCLPILLADLVGRRVAAVHAGWRGTLRGIARQAVARLVAAGGRAEDIVAAIGPGIGGCCYEVGEEVVSAFGPKKASHFRPGPRGRPHLDLRAMNVEQLLEAGLLARQIANVADCTSCRSDLYFSFRRDGPGGGRMINYIGFS